MRRRLHRLLAAGVIGGGITPPWYLAGSIPVANCVVAYASKGAATYTASKSNLVLPGTHDATDGAAVPTWLPEDGWSFNATDQYLTQDFVLLAGHTLIVKFTGAVVNENDVVAGARVSGANGIFIQPNNIGDNIGWTNGSTVTAATGIAAGVLAVAGAKGYRNAVDESVTMVIANNTNTTRPIFIGCLNTAGTAGVFFGGKIQALAMYNITLSQAQITAVTTAMNAISYVAGIKALANQKATLGNVLQYEYTQAWSMRAVCKTPVVNNSPAILFSNVPNGSGFPGYEVYLGGGDANPFVRIIHNIDASESVWVQAAAAVLSDGVLHDLWVTYDGSGAAAGVAIYVDGVAQVLTVLQDTLGGQSIVNAGQSMVIANQTGLEATYFYNGELRALAIDDVVRNQVYVSANSDVRVLPAAAANRVLCLVFTAGSGLGVQDLSSSGYHATLTTADMWITY